MFIFIILDIPQFDLMLCMDSDFKAKSKFPSHASRHETILKFRPTIILTKIIAINDITMNI